MRGVGLGVPILLGYLPVGIAFGILAAGAGFSLIQAMACSAFAIAGAGQFIALAVMKTGGDAVSVLLATGVVNLRYVLFSTTMTPYWKRIPLLGQAALAFSLTDETFAVNITDLEAGRATPASMAGVGAVSWVGWVTGTALGAGASSLIGNPSRWGVDFAMAAMFTALLVAQVKDRRHLAVGAIAGVLAGVGALVLPGTWYIVVAAMGAALAGAVIYRDAPDHPGDSSAGAS